MFVPDNHLRTAIPIIALSVFSTSAFAQTVGGASGGPLRPRYHLGLGVEGGQVEVPQEGCSDCDHTAEGLSVNALWRVKRNWLVGVGWSLHDAGLGHSRQYDTTVVIPAHQELGFENGSFVLIWVPEHDLRQDHEVRIAQRTMGIDLSGGITVPSRWPRRRCHLTGSGLAGLRLLRINEKHDYRINTGGDPYLATTRADDLALLCTIHARIDAHFTRFVSLFTGLTAAAPLRHPDLSSETSHEDEHVTVPRNRTLRTVWLTFGIALHL